MGVFVFAVEYSGVSEALLTTENADLPPKVVGRTGFRWLWRRGHTRSHSEHGS